MEDGLAGSRLGAGTEAAEARAQPGVTLRPFAPFSGAAEADEGSGDWSFIDCEMEEVDLQDLPSATIACHLDPRVFVDGLCRGHSRHVEVPRLAVKSELQWPACATATAMWALSRVCDLHHSSRQRQILNSLSKTRKSHPRPHGS